MQSCITLAKVGKRQAGHAPVPPKGPLTTNPFHFTGHNTLHFSTLREDGSPKKGRLPPPSLRPPTHAKDSLGQTCTILGPKITVNLLFTQKK